ncbi:MAG: MalY/PatB family protein [Lachnospiraceae bacterium]|nr:MalY/PatB family protein [Lachnospiraceae bacterium]
MTFNFDEEIVRLGSGSIKWDQYNDPDIIALSNADMDFKSAPCIREALVRCAQTGQYGYTLKPDSYYKAIIGWYQRKFGLEVPREWILHTPGIWPAARICFGTYAKPGDKILVQSPHFHPIIVCIQDAGCEPVTNPMPLVDGRYLLDLEDFEQKIIEHKPSVFFMVNPQNPTGRAFSMEELTALGKICAKHGVVMISDEVHSNVLYNGHKHIPALALDKEITDNLILITSASKGYNIMGLTHCILIIPNSELRARYEKSMCGYSLDFAVNTFSVVATEAAFSQEADAWLADLNAYLQGNLDYLIEYVKANIPQIKVIEPESSYLVWLDCRELNKTPEELKELFLKRAKVGLTFGEGYGPLGEGFERINIACTRKTLKEALERIRRAIA